MDKDNKQTKFNVIYGTLFSCAKSVIESLKHAPIISDHVKNASKAGKQNAGILFEVAVYLTARLDVAMVQFEQDANTRRNLFFYITDALNKTLGQYLENINLLEVIDNRMSSYGKCFREGKEDVFKQLHFILLNNIKHAMNTTKLEVWKDGISPIVLSGALGGMYDTITMVDIEKNIIGSFACSLKHVLQDNSNFTELSLEEINQRIEVGVEEAKKILSDSQDTEEEFDDGEEFEEDEQNEPNKELLDKADKLCKEDRYDEAIDVYKKIIRMDPNCCNAYYGLSCAYSYKEIEDETKDRYAEEHVALYEKVAQIDPNFNSYQVLAGHLADVGRYEDALSCYDKAIEYDLNELKKDSSYMDWLKDEYEGKAKVLNKMKRYEEALKCYDKAIEKSIDTDGNDRTCSDLYAAKREIYCIVKDNRMVSEMDKKLAKAEDLWLEHKKSGEYEKSIGDKFKPISKRLDKGITREEKLREDMCKLVLLKLKEAPRHVFTKNRTEVVNATIDQILEEVEHEKDSRYIEKAYVARLVNDVLDSEKKYKKLWKRIFPGFFMRIVEFLKRKQ